MTKITIDLQIATDSSLLPSADDFQQWAEAVFDCVDSPVKPENDEEFKPEDDAEFKSKDDELEVCIRIVDADEIQALNKQFRHKDKPTNVLSFPYDQVFDEIDDPSIGDIIICASIVEQEAQSQGKSAQAHWAHMCIHGLLHLLAYDHQNDQDAEKMENLEKEILKKLGFSDPYAISNL